MDINNKHIIKDPVYGTMSISVGEHKFIKPFLDHPLFQRLRHIKQLSFVDLIFPGAVHTRFNHSLGCSYLCSRIFKQLHANISDLDEEMNLIILAGLLHDIGHGPFSHAFENVGIFKEHDIKHEDWFNLFIEDMFNSPTIKPYGGELKNKLVCLFSKDYTGKPWLKSVISSQIDADRMDYVLRDSLFCGVKYGEYDLEWLLACLSIDKGNNLIITEKGVGCAEQFLHARHLLHKNVYYHLKSNAIAYCAIDFLDSLIADINQLKKILPNSKLLDFFISSMKNKSHDKQKFMRSIYNEYKNLVDFDIWIAIREIAVSPGSSTCQQLARRLYYRKLPIALKINSTSIDFVKELVASEASTANLQSWQIKVITKSVCIYKGESQRVFIEDGHGIKRPLEDHSEMISKVSNQHDGVSFLYIDYDSYGTQEIKNIISKCNEYAAFIYN